MRNALLLLLIFLTAYFPAYLGYQIEYARVGYIFTIAFALASYIPRIKAHTKRWWISLGAIALWGVVIETIGITTCFPYGCFTYSEQLWPKILWWAPRLLLATYPPLVLWVYQQILRLRHLLWQGRKEKSWPLLRIMWGLWLVAVDLVLDPIAVRMGLWSFEQSGWRFGIPWTNFAGWMLSGTVAMIILDYLIGKDYKPWSYDWGLWLTMVFFVGYAVWWLVINH